MTEMGGLGRLLMLLGSLLLVLGAVLALGVKVPLIGRLPGDFVFRRDSTTFYIPLATCLVIVSC